jgi:hypothetical protein
MATDAIDRRDRPVMRLLSGWQKTLRPFLPVAIVAADP